MGEADEIRELAERLLTHMLPGSAVPTVTLLPGRTPDSPDVSVPSPPGARVIGSLIREPGWQLPRDIEVVLDAPGSEDPVLRFYEQQFGQRGWRVAPQVGHGGGGFMAGPEGEGRMFRRGHDGLTILLTARSVKAGWVEVRLRTQWIPADTEIHRPPPGHDLIPILRQPAGVRVVNASGSGGGASWMSEAVVETATAVSELQAHFASQLEKAGWKKKDNGTAGPLAWSSWVVPGKGSEWYGYLVVVEAPGENRRSLWVRIESTRDGRDGGWHASTSALSSS